MGKGDWDSSVLEGFLADKHDRPTVIWLMVKFTVMISGS